MSNIKTPMARGYHNRLLSNKASHRSLSRSRKSVRFNDAHRSCSSAHDPQQILLLNSNDKTPRRTSSASSPRSHVRPDNMIMSLQQLTKKQTMVTNDLSCQTLQEQTTSLSQVSLLTTDQFEIPMERIIRECIVCITEKFLNEFEGIYSDSCVHIERKVCNSCVYENTKCRVEDSMIYYGDVTCPELNCHGIFDYHGIRQILLFIGKNNTLFEQYDQHLIYLHLEQMPEFVWCAYECGSGQLYDFGGSSNPMVACVKCNRHTCFKHRVIWHTDMSCDQYDLLKSQPSETDANNKWLELFTKQCPQCQWHIQKNEGCDHMTCRYCKHEFCWECFVDYKLIGNQGNHQHKTSCSYYQPPPAPTPPDQS